MMQLRPANRTDMCAYQASTGTTMRAPKTYVRRPRTAFTIVELLVSMALVLFIMVILSEAFIQSVAAFSQLKAVGDLQEKMRAATIILRRDLGSPHFWGKPPGSTATSAPSLSDWDMRTVTPPDGLAGYGFFRIWEGFDTEQDANGVADADATEGTDDMLNSTGTGIPSSRAANHVLHFTANLSGSRPENYFSGAVLNSDWADWTGLGPQPYMQAYYTGPSQLQSLYFSQWAEIAYFLRPTGEFAGTTPLYGLYRRQRTALAPADETSTSCKLDTEGSATGRIPATELASYYDLSCNVDPNPAGSSYLYFNGPADLITPERRMFANQTVGSAGMPAGYGTANAAPPLY